MLVEASKGLAKEREGSRKCARSGGGGGVKGSKEGGKKIVGVRKREKGEREWSER